MKNELPTSQNLSRKELTNTLPSGDFKNFISHFWNFLDFSGNGETAELQPKIEVSENDTDVSILAEMPGVDEKDLNLQVSSDGYLTISGQKKETNEHREKGNYFSEIYYGSFKRTIPLPWDLDFDNADAQYDDGVLMVSIPKSQNEKTKMKKINVSKGRRNQQDNHQTKN